MSITTDVNGLIIAEAGDRRIQTILVDYRDNTTKLDAAIAKKNRNGSTPTINDDAAHGYSIGSYIFIAAGPVVWICTDATTGAAVWKQIWPATDAATITGLAATAFALLAGRAGNQVLYGGTGAGGSLTLASTSHGTKGKLLFGTSAYDEVNNRLGINTVSPVNPLDIYQNASVNGPLISLRSLVHDAGGSHSMIRWGDSSQTTSYQMGALIWEGMFTDARGRMHIACSSSTTGVSVTLADAILTVLYGGKVGINKVLPVYALDVVGDIACNGNFRGDGSLLTNLPNPGSSFWTTFPGTPTRASDTSFSITDTSNANLYDKMFGPGTVLKWEKSGGGFQCAVITGATYGANAVTYTILGNTLAAGFIAMKYCIHKAKRVSFFYPGTLPGNTATTDMFKPWYAPYGILILCAQTKYKTAPTTTNGVFDINSAGTTIFTTKLVQTAAQTIGVKTVCDCVLGTAAAIIAKDALITGDYDSGHATTPGAAVTIDIEYIPESWRYLA